MIDAGKITKSVNVEVLGDMRKTGRLTVRVQWAIHRASVSQAEGWKWLGLRGILLWPRYHRLKLVNGRDVLGRGGMGAIVEERRGMKRLL